MTHKTISEVERNYRWYQGVTDDDEGQSADFPADFVDDLDEIFAQKALYEGDSGSSFTADDRSFIATALARLSRKSPTFGSKFTDLVKWLVDEVEASQVGTVKDEKEVERQNRLVSAAEKLKNNA